VNDFPLAVNFVEDVGYTNRHLLRPAGLIRPSEVLDAACHPHLAVAHDDQLDEISFGTRKSSEYEQQRSARGRGPDMNGGVEWIRTSGTSA
jgi:hypothetical protein